MVGVCVRECVREGVRGWGGRGWKMLEYGGKGLRRMSAR